MALYFAVQFKSGKWILCDMWSIGRYKKSTVKSIHNVNTREEARNVIRLLNSITYTSK